MSVAELSLGWTRCACSLTLERGSPVSASEVMVVGTVRFICLRIVRRELITANSGMMYTFDVIRLFQSAIRHHCGSRKVERALSHMMNGPIVDVGDIPVMMRKTIALTISVIRQDDQGDSQDGRR